MKPCKLVLRDRVQVDARGAIIDKAITRVCMDSWIRIDSKAIRLIRVNVERQVKDEEL